MQWLSSAFGKIKIRVIYKSTLIVYEIITILGMVIPRNSNTSLDDLYPPLFYPPDFQSPYTTVPDRFSTTQDNPGAKSSTTTTSENLVTTVDEDKNTEGNTAG